MVILMLFIIVITINYRILKLLLGLLIFFPIAKVKKAHYGRSLWSDMKWSPGYTVMWGRKRKVQKSIYRILTRCMGRRDKYKNNYTDWFICAEETREGQTLVMCRGRVGQGWKERGNETRMRHRDESLQLWVLEPQYFTYLNSEPLKSSACMYVGGHSK